VCSLRVLFGGCEVANDRKIYQLKSFFTTAFLRNEKISGKIKRSLVIKIPFFVARKSRKVYTMCARFFRCCISAVCNHRKPALENWDRFIPIAETIYSRLRKTWNSTAWASGFVGMEENFRALLECRAMSHCLIISVKHRRKLRAFQNKLIDLCGNEILE